MTEDRLHTARLTLRPLVAGDLDTLHAIFSDQRAMRYWDRPAWQDREQTRALLTAFARVAPDDHLEYGVEHAGQLIGRVGMWRRFEIGYILHPDHWGQGFGREAVGALLQACVARFPQAPCFTAEVDPRNADSCKLLEHLGFARTGLVEKNFDYGGIEMCDTAYYAYTPPGRA